MSRRALCIDTELSCWEDATYQKKQTLEVFEYGMAIIDLDKMRISRSGRYYVKNERHEVSDFCTQLTGITQKKLSNQGFSLQVVTKMLAEKWGSRNKNVPILAWGDERVWVERDCQAKNTPYPFHNGLINLAHYFRFNQPNLPRNLSLFDACTQMNADIVHPIHSAQSDAETLANLALSMVKNKLIWPNLAGNNISP